MIQTIIDELIFLAALDRFEIKEIRIHPQIKTRLIEEIGGHPFGPMAAVKKWEYSGYPLVLDAKVLLEVKINAQK